MCLCAYRHSSKGFKAVRHQVRVEGFGHDLNTHIWHGLSGAA